MRVDYNNYKYSFKEWLLYGAVGAGAGFGLMYLFYSGILYCVVGAVAGAFIFLLILLFFCKFLF